MVETLRTEAERKYQTLPLSVRCYFEWEKQKREAPLGERIKLQDLQETVRSRWNPIELGLFYSYIELQTQELIKRSQNGRK